MSKRKAGPVGLRTKVFAAFALFSVVIVAFLWLFQIVLLPPFYETTTRHRIVEGASDILAAGDREGMRAVAERVALENNAGIRLFVVNGNQVSTVASIRGELGPVIHLLSNKQLNDLYDGAEATPEGVWAGYRLANGGFHYAWGEDDGEMDEDKPVDRRRVYARLGTAATGETCFILMDVPSEPIGGTVAVLSFQLLVLTVVLAVLSVVLAGVISKRLSRPLSFLNVAARRLPKGTYPRDYREDDYREVAELSETMAKAADEIGKTEALQRELIANVSHDLRTPLTMIIGYAEVMRDIGGENTPENMQVIIDEAHRLSAMVGDLVEISRYQSGAERVSPEAFSLSDTVRELLGSYRTLLAPHGFTFTDKVEDGLTVTADKKRILQVVRNLLDNAVNYSEDVKEVTLCARRIGGAVRVEVSDRGRGIPREELENVWQRYYRAKGNHNRSRSGSGLGLSIVRECLEFHSARYGVESKEGEGSTFWFELPDKK